MSTVEEAIAPDAPQLHSQYKGNVASHTQLEIGDVDKGFKVAEHVIEKEFRTSTVHQGYIEPHSCTVHWRDDDRIFIWTGPAQLSRVRIVFEQKLVNCHVRIF